MIPAARGSGFLSFLRYLTMAVATIRVRPWTGNAVSAAAGVRMLELPMSPPKILKAIGEQKAGKKGKASGKS